MSTRELGPDTGLDSIELGSTEPRALLESRLQALRERLRAVPEDAADQRATVLIEAATTLVELGRGAEGWADAREALDLALAAEDWEHAALACERLYECDQPQSLSALGQGIWLAVTYPVEPQLTVAMLQHLVDETPDDSDGAAVAAATAHYVADLRTEGRAHEDLGFFTQRMLGAVARRHAQVETQEAFDAWLARLELTDPSKFLIRLRNVVDVLVQDDWWFDRDALRDRLPVN